MTSRDEIKSRIEQMSEERVKAILKDIFLEMESIGFGGKTKQDAFESIEEIFNEEVIYTSLFESKKDKK